MYAVLECGFDRRALYFGAADSGRGGRLAGSQFIVNDLGQFVHGSDSADKTSVDETRWRTGNTEVLGSIGINQHRVAFLARVQALIE